MITEDQVQDLQSPKTESGHVNESLNWYFADHHHTPYHVCMIFRAATVEEIVVRIYMNIRGILDLRSTSKYPCAQEGFLISWDGCLCTTNTTHSLTLRWTATRTPHVHLSSLSLFALLCTWLRPRPPTEAFSEPPVVDWLTDRSWLWCFGYCFDRSIHIILNGWPTCN